MANSISYAQAIRHGFQYLLAKYPEVFVIGQGLWSPWYVGSSMTDLDKEFGRERIMDSPVCEAGTTGIALGASLLDYRPVVVHPRMDFMLLAVDQIVTQAAKWSSMFGGQARPHLTIRGIINRAGEQGAQHSQALHNWFSNIPGLRVVMPATPLDARDLLISSVLCNDPVLYIDDRALYDQKAELGEPVERCLAGQGPRILCSGEHLTIVGIGYGTQISLEVAESLAAHNISCEVVDLRILNPLDESCIITSVIKTKRLVVIDPGWRSCSMAAEIVARVAERGAVLQSAPRRFHTANTPAPTSRALEKEFFFSKTQIVNRILEMF